MLTAFTEAVDARAATPARPVALRVSPADAHVVIDGAPVILDARCNYCHYDGGIAPFALTDYETASANAGVAVLAVNDEIMPPWPANADCRDYLGDRSLSDAEIATLNQWLDDGAPEGDPAREDDPLPTSRPSMSRVDATLTSRSRTRRRHPAARPTTTAAS